MLVCVEIEKNCNYQSSNNGKLKKTKTKKKTGSSSRHTFVPHTRTATLRRDVISSVIPPDKIFFF